MQKNYTETRALKEKVPTGLGRKQKSPYALQYLDFQRRFDNKRAGILPSLGVRTRKLSLGEKMNGQEYLALAKRLKCTNEQILFGEGKENNNQAYVEEYGDEGLTELKGLIDKMKVRSTSRPLSTKTTKTTTTIANIIKKVNSTNLNHIQYSQQMKGLPKQENMESRCSTRSKAYSNALAPLREVDENAGMKFLDYKKGKKELPNWMKYD